MIFPYADQMVSTSCCTCGVQFMVPQKLLDAARDYDASLKVFCPYGHSFIFTGKKKIERLEAMIVRLEADLKLELRRRERAEQKLFRLRRKAAKGVK